MKIIRVLTIVAVMMLALGFGVDSAQAVPASYSSSIELQNLSTSATAHVTVDFYSSSTGTVDFSFSVDLDPAEMVSYYPLTDANLPGSGEPSSGFSGSIVVSSDVPLGAISQLTGKDGSNNEAFMATYKGFQSGGTTAQLPLLFYNNYGFYTWFHVQNIGTATTDISVAYSDGTSATYDDLAPGASALFDQATESAMSHPIKFSGVVTSTASDIAVVVIEAGPTTMFAYNGYPPSASAKMPVFPLVQFNNYNYFSGVQIMNMDAANPSTVTVHYVHKPGGFGTDCDEIRTIPAHDSVTFGQYVFTHTGANIGFVSTTCIYNEQFGGAGYVTANTANVDLIANVNQLNNVAMKGAAYYAFNPDAADRYVAFPAIYEDNFEWWNSINLQNVGGSTITTGQITCTYTGTDNLSATPMTGTYTNPADLVVNGVSNKQFLNYLIVPNRTNQAGFVGDVVCVGPVGSKLVGMSNKVLLTGTLDTFAVYEGFVYSTAP